MRTVDDRNRESSQPRVKYSRHFESYISPVIIDDIVQLLFENTRQESEDTVDPRARYLSSSDDRCRVGYVLRVEVPTRPREIRGDEKRHLRRPAIDEKGRFFVERAAQDHEHGVFALTLHLLRPVFWTSRF